MVQETAKNLVSGRVSSHSPLPFGGFPCARQRTGNDGEKSGAIRRMKRYERQMPASEKTAALHDVSEKKGVSCLESKCHKVLTHSNSES
jgi:hypothetical protein